MADNRLQGQKSVRLQGWHERQAVLPEHFNQMHNQRSKKKQQPLICNPGAGRDRFLSRHIALKQAICAYPCLSVVKTLSAFIGG